MFDHTGNMTMKSTFKKSVIFLLTTAVFVFLLNALTLVDRHSAVTWNTKVAEDVEHYLKIRLLSTHEQTRRLNRIHRVCSQLAVPGSVENVLIDETSNMSYCSSSTYGIRMFRLLPADVPNTSVRPSSHVTNVGTPLTKFSKTLATNFKEDEGRQKVMATYRFMMAENPYERLWVIYVDKFVLIDDLFWTLYAPEIRRTYEFRPNGQADARKKTLFERFDITTDDMSSLEFANCLDISFDEFLHYVADVGSASPDMLDVHVRPLHYSCSPCQFKPHYIGKIETMGLDKENLLEDSQTDLTFESFVINDIKTQTALAFDIVIEIQQQKQCVSVVQLEERLVVAFVIRGYIPENSLKVLAYDLPMGQIALTTRIVDIYTQSNRSESDVRKQQRQIRESAYLDISVDILSELKYLYRYDFLLFGYNQDPLVSSG